MMPADYDAERSALRLGPLIDRKGRRAYATSQSAIQSGNSGIDGDSGKIEIPVEILYKEAPPCRSIFTR